MADEAARPGGCGALAAIASGALAAAALPLVVPAVSLRPVDPAGWLELLAWCALVPAFLALARCRRARAAAGLGLLAGLVYFGIALHWIGHAITVFGGRPPAIAAAAVGLLVLLLAVHWALAFGAAALLRLRLGWPLWAQLPCVWTAAELLRGHLFSGFPWAHLGYTQARTPAVAQLAALGGVHAVGALVVLVNAVLAEGIAAARARRPAPRLALVTALALVAGALGYGALRLRSIRAELALAPTVRVGLVQPNLDQATKNRGRALSRYILGRLVPATLEAERAGAELVAWPETAYPFDLPPDAERIDPRGSGLEGLTRAHLLTGVLHSRPMVRDGGLEPVTENGVLLAAPSLEVVGSARKLHLVPFGEYVPSLVRRVLPYLRQVVPGRSGVAGERPTVLVLPAPSASHGEPGARRGPVRIAPLVCFDAVFPELTRAFLGQDPPPDLLVNATNDAWYGYSSGPYQFLDIVRLRAIEARRTVIRPAYAGVTAMILPTGELAPGTLEVGPVDPARVAAVDPPGLLVADAPLLSGRTPYARAGDAFALACAILSGAAVAWAATRRSPGVRPQGWTFSGPPERRSRAAPDRRPPRRDRRGARRRPPPRAR